MPADEPPEEMQDELDDRVALLFVACDEVLAPGARMVLALRVVCGLSIAQTAMHLGIQESAAAARLTRAKRALAQARGEFRIPEPGERTQAAAGRARLRGGHVHRRPSHGARATGCTDGHGQPGTLDRGRARGAVPRRDRGPRAARRHPARAGAPAGPRRRGRRCADAGRGRPLRLGPGAAAGGLADAAVAARGDGRFALEAAISGLHSVAPSFAQTDWSRIVQLYEALQEVWPSPSVGVALLAAQGQQALADGGDLVAWSKVCNGWRTRVRRTPEGTRRSPWPTCAGAPAAATRPRTATGRSPARWTTRRSAGSACAGPTGRRPRGPCRGRCQWNARPHNVGSGRPDGRSRRHNPT